MSGLWSKYGSGSMLMRWSYFSNRTSTTVSANKTRKIPRSVTSGPPLVTEGGGGGEESTGTEEITATRVFSSSALCQRLEVWASQHGGRTGLERSVIVAARAVSSSRREQCHRRGESSVIVVARVVSSARREHCHRRDESSVIIAARAVSSSRREQCHRRGESSVIVGESSAIVAARAVSSARRDQCHRRGKLGQVAVLYSQIVQDKQRAILYWYGTLLYCTVND